MLLVGLRRSWQAGAAREGSFPFLIRASSSKVGSLPPPSQVQGKQETEGERAAINVRVIAQDDRPAGCNTEGSLEN